MSDGDFRSTEQSVTVASDGHGADRARQRRRLGHGAQGRLRRCCAGEVLDAAVMRRAALELFLAAQVAEAKEQGVLFSVHLKATMMKVSDPIIFGHAVRAYFPIVFAEHGAALGAAGVNANDGMAALISAIEDAAGRRARARSRRRSTPPTRTGRRWRWSTPTAASPTSTSPAT